MTDANLKTLLQNTRRIAVVGLSDKPHRDSYEVAAYLLQNGFEIIPVNPVLAEKNISVLGQKVYASLLDIPFPIDMVNVFRRTEEVLPLAHEALQFGAKSFWQQLGVANTQAFEMTRAAGLTSIIDRCIKIEHRRFN